MESSVVISVEHYFSSLSLGEKVSVLERLFKIMKEEVVEEKIPVLENIEATEEVRLNSLDKLSGAWSDTPEDIIDIIYNTRTSSSREYNLDDE